MMQRCIGRLKTDMKPEKLLYAGVMLPAYSADDMGAGKLSHALKMEVHRYREQPTSAPCDCPV